MTAIIVFAAKYLIVLPIILAVGYALVTRRRREFLIFAALVFVTSYLLAFAASSLYDNPRPFVVLGTQPLVAHTPDNGFPSNHTLLASALAASVTPFNPPLGAFMWLTALLTGAGRVLALVHHSIDILASLLIALVSIPIAWRARHLFQRISTKRGV